MIDFSQTNASRIRPALVLAVAAFAAACSHAQGHGGHGNPPSPPPEAYTACQGKAEGDSVTLTMPDGKTAGRHLPQPERAAGGHAGRRARRRRAAAPSAAVIAWPGGPRRRAVCNPTGLRIGPHEKAHPHEPLSRCR